MKTRLLTLIAASITGAALLPASAGAATATIGQLAPGASPTALCTGHPFDNFAPTVASGNSYVVPPAGAGGGWALTSWSHNAAAGAGQKLTMKVYRLVSGSEYEVVAHDGPKDLTPEAVNTFAGVNIAVKPGDILGMSDPDGSGDSACYFASPADSMLFASGDLADGGSADFVATVPDLPNITAVLTAPDPARPGPLVPVPHGKPKRCKHKKKGKNRAAAAKKKKCKKKKRK